mgnify:CR=1 FL=1
MADGTGSAPRTTALAMSTTAFTVCFAVWVMFSIIGIPPFGGFFSKLMVIQGVLQSGNMVIACLAVFTAILSGIAFLALLLSEEIRRRLKVLITKHFYAQKYDYRQEWLKFSENLSLCARAGDVNADGYDDLLIRSHNQPGSSSTFSRT